MNRDTKFLIALILDMISKEHRLRPPIYVGALRMTDSKMQMILNFGRRDLCRRSRIELLCGIVRTGYENASDGS